MSIKLKPITETSWLVLGDMEGNRIGLLSQLRNQYILMVKDVKKHFLSKKEVNEYFKENVFDNVIEEAVQEEKKDYFINGYPVDFDSPLEVLITGNKLPLFSKKATSEVYYSAGYYCVNFPKNWMPAMCPKLVTLQAYEYAGPFKTEMEMKSNLARLRKEKNARKF